MMFSILLLMMMVFTAIGYMEVLGLAGGIVGFVSTILLLILFSKNGEVSNGEDC